MKPIRNAKLEQTRDFADEVIDKCGFFVMATTDPSGEPYCIPLSMAREGQWLYFHSALEGHKIDNLRFNNRVCICCVGAYRIPAGKFNVDYQSAVIFGTAAEILSEDEKIHALELISRRYTPDNMPGFDASIKKSLERTSVWKIHIDETSGKGMSF
ncbi:MAG: pyridoxamine 5'-phosphate oxidase family protein [Treponema sp.]|nr:pyridoxamine 5'-phosphate oxidase family protein [Treponema sp.]